MLRQVRASIKIALGIALGLILAEAIFWIRDRGAFAHVNFYVADPLLGARLRPNASMRIAFANNGVSTVHTNGRGYRGADWPTAPGPDEILVVGDSQVFGLGVDDDETFSAELARLSTVPVLNAGVPTYGPGEYTALVEKLLDERKPRAVVYVVNVANDLFELDRPNRERHAVWDGWAVRKESAPIEVTWFPFRETLMSQSHLVHALRRLAHASDAADVQFPSEGTWRDLADTAKSTPPPATLPSSSEQQAKLSERQTTDTALREVGREVEQRFMSQAERNAVYRQTAKQLSGYQGDPSDILVNRFAEAARPVNATAAQLLFAALQMERNDEALRKLARESGDEALTALLEKRSALREKMRALSGVAVGDPVSLSLDRALMRTKRACDRTGARLLVVALPLDVQVSAAEWRKYGAHELDLTPTLVLLENIVRRAELAGVSGLDATPALRGAEPGAFLDGDLHMSKRGHAALARAIADALARPPPEISALPLGRSVMPTRAEWLAASDVPLPQAPCQVKLVREWLRVHCPARFGNDRFLPVGLELVSGGHGDAMLHVSRRTVATLIAPIFEGDDLRALLTTENGSSDVTARWPMEGSLSFAFSPLDPARKSAGGAKPPSLEAKTDVYGEYVDPRCSEKDSARCRLDTRSEVVTCGVGELAYGALRRCMPRCKEGRSCDRGRCVQWNAQSVCVEP